MSTQRAGNGATQLTNQQIFSEIAKEVVNNAALTSRLVTVVEKLTDRLDLLESSDTVRDPVPADFDFDYQVELTDEGRVVIEQPEPNDAFELPPEESVFTSAEELDKSAAIQSAQDQKEREAMDEDEQRVSIEQPILLNSLKTVTKAVARSTVNPVLNNVRLSFGDDELGISATDGEISISQVLSSDNCVAEDLLVPAKLFMETIRGLPKSNILTLDFFDGAVHIEEGGANFSVGTATAKEFPELPDCSDGPVSYVSCYKLKRLLHRAGFAAVRESSTGAVHYTNGVFIRIHGEELELASTDGHRLAYEKCDRQGDAIEDLHLLIPARAAKILGQQLPDEGNLVEIRSVGEFVEFRIPPHSTGSRVRKELPATTITSKLFDIKYPDIHRVFPKKYDARIDVDREGLNAALKRVLLVCRQKDQNPVAQFIAQGGVLSIKADAGESNQIEEKLDCQGGDIKAALNPQYVLDVLSVLSGESVRVNWLSEVDPVTITCGENPEFKYVVMPIRMD